MIPVLAAAEPADFDARVRQPGLSAIGERVGEPARVRRTGPRLERRASSRGELTSADFPPYWRNATDSLLAAYNRVCAYACLYIERLTGASSVDHWAPKSLRWDQVYEWTNYRLACSLMNSRKGDFGDVLDPFQIESEVFALDLVTLRAVPGPKAGDRHAKVLETIERLGLDGSEYADALSEYYMAYKSHDISFGHLARRAPFLAYELRRQGQLNPEDR